MYKNINTKSMFKTQQYTIQRWGNEHVKRMLTFISAL